VLTPGPLKSTEAASAGLAAEAQPARRGTAPSPFTSLTRRSISYTHAADRGAPRRVLTTTAVEHPTDSPHERRPPLDRLYRAREVVVNQVQHHLLREM
jgi:hypothetical protein